MESQRTRKGFQAIFWLVDPGPPFIRRKANPGVLGDAQTLEIPHGISGIIPSVLSCSSFLAQRASRSGENQDRTSTYPGLSCETVLCSLIRLDPKRPSSSLSGESISSIIDALLSREVCQ